MSKESILEIDNVEDMIKELVKNRDGIIEEFAKAYLAETETMPSEVVLVEQRMPLTDDNIIETVYFFRRKDDGKSEGDGNE